MMWGNGMNAGGWVLMSLMMIVFWGLLAAVIVWLVRLNRRPQVPAPGSTAPGSTAPGSAAFRILEERLARGELTEQEYRLRRDLLNEP